MSEYIVKIGFWLRAYDGFTVEAGSDAEAIEKAKVQAKAAMEWMAHTEHIDVGGRREGIIAFIDARPLMDARPSWTTSSSTATASIQRSRPDRCNIQSTQPGRRAGLCRFRSHSMPEYTIEVTYHLPVYRHRTYSADTSAAACRLAVEDDA